MTPVAPRRLQISLTIAVLAISSLLLLARLGHYALWDDEANTAIFAHSVWETGDTSAMYGKNVMAFDYGLELTNLKGRWHPPFQYYIVAPFVGLFGMNGFAARLPYALFGIATIAMLLRWMWRDHADAMTWIIASIAMVTNVSLILYFRQCRYYGLAIFLSVAIAYLYVHWDNTLRATLLLLCAASALLATNYLAFAAVALCAGVDILVFNRWPRISWRHAIILIAPIFIGGLLLSRVYSPLGKEQGYTGQGAWITNHLLWLWWFLRDSNACEYGVGPLIVIAPLLYLLPGKRQPGLLRSPVALAVYILFVAVASIHGAGQIGEIRYICPIIPLCVFIGVFAARELSFGKLWIALPLGLITFGTNWLTLGPLADTGVRPPRWRSTICAFAEELISPPSDPYTEAARWLNANVPAGKSIYVCPLYMSFPLMIYAPHLLYAWELRWPPQEQFKNFDLIYFGGKAAPDYILAFGPYGLGMLQNLPFPMDVPMQYRPCAMIPFYYHDEYKPELFSRTFVPITSFDERYEAIYVFEREVPKGDFHL